ncbi:hypothetical protein E2C01_092976 [Portunus trituberculatus]|uniref:Uncharacterized protein n=1 Tax=Portunus trituberculatus TaxID=210409 RepID=A0A5B7JNM1_PORTR|nr:hypothetical protein [Portunus trituberculatus]
MEKFLMHCRGNVDKSGTSDVESFGPWDWQQRLAVTCTQRVAGLTLPLTFLNDTSKDEAYTEYLLIHEAHSDDVNGFLLHLTDNDEVRSYHNGITTPKKSFLSLSLPQEAVGTLSS